MLDIVSFGLVRGLDGFLEVSPGLGQLAKARWLKRVWQAKSVVQHIIPVLKGERDISEAIGRYAGGKIFNRMLNPVSTIITKAHLRAKVKRKTTKVNGIGGRTWIDPLVDADSNGRVIKNMVIIYHDANKAGKHIDIHIGHLSFIMRVSGKPVEKQLKFNNKGELTQVSKDALMNHVRKEIASHSRVPQNLDHSISNAKCTWNIGTKGLNGYGSGNTRQIVSESKVEFYHTHLNSSLHMYAPIITPHQGLYLYQIYNGQSTGVPICIWGVLNPRDENFKDRLHLKMTQEKDFDKFKAKTDSKTITEKIDGASSYAVQTNEGTKLYSPRTSKTTGRHIEYTFKVPEISNAKGPQSVGMGELTFYKNTICSKALWTLFHIRSNTVWNRLSAAEIGGVLNSHAIRPKNIYPILHLYRIDRYNSKDISNLDFFSNRRYQYLVSQTSKYISVVPFTKPWITKLFAMEGIVAVPKGKSIDSAYKLKWNGDEIDMIITKIDFSLSDKNRVQGNITATYLDKEYNFGPGQTGDTDTCISLLSNPTKYIGTVIKTVPRRGGVARASRITEFHLDKGLGY